MRQRPGLVQRRAFGQPRDESWPILWGLAFAVAVSAGLWAGLWLLGRLALGLAARFALG